MRKATIILSFLWAIFVMMTPISKADNEVVYVVPIEETVEKGLHAFINRAVTTAEENQASAIIFEVNTPGGEVEAAKEIGRVLTSTNIKTISFVNKQALSAGAFISLNMDEIYMTPGATMGSAAIIDQEGNTADKKAVSAWLSAMTAAAEQSGRNPEIAQAMADDSIDLPELGAPKGKLLTLTASQADEVEYSEGTFATQAELLEHLGYEDAEVRSIEESFSEKLARFITHPIIVPILLSIGSIGLLLELYSPGFGIPGIMGLTALGLFFYGHMVAGFAGYESLIVFIIGIGLIIAEFFLPGGIAGVLGIAAVIGSLFMAGADVQQMATSIMIAAILSIAVSILMVKVFGKKMKFFKKLILSDSTNTERGYISNKSRSELIGKQGYALTGLRPSGTIVIENERIDVVSEGGFIKKDAKVEVIKAEGSRVVVRELTNLDK
ncbi:nodulation protein NfeD [Cytobacillus kochii]|uniref:NfeD family protein n=1 Tax=Cytobacillus kochii TaxID=859143 RepID=UPI001CD4D62C|nr:nodulation protein NfeD [Cytobacillus kochii]MCA1025433.1 nodulation protein NfeD [Cytobacillus kochii]